MAENFDVVIVGGGIGGGALGTVLARAGLSVLVLEKSTVYRDIVRGEWMAPWGVLELIRLGLYDAVRAAGGHHVARHWACDEDLPHDEALAMAVDLTTFVPGVAGPLCIGHPALCQLFIELAAESGVTVRRGVSDVRISAGPSPSVIYQHEQTEHRATCRLIGVPTRQRPSPALPRLCERTAQAIGRRQRAAGLPRRVPTEESAGERALGQRSGRGAVQFVSERG
ncbi:MAG: FAD-dependent monooxygenase [Deltaproteobacteria bacterium]|nr:FAD-dependent monooxygenase [Deltaproteobacteria bacterium]